MAKPKKQLDAMIVEMLSAADAYCAENDTGICALGLLIMKDGKFFTRMRVKGNCTIKTYRTVMQWFKDNSHKAIPVSKVNECRV
jgi:hypothetical protein